MKRWIIVLTGFLLTAGRAEARDPAPNPAIEGDLRATYAWTNFDGRTGEIIAPGVVLTIRKNGITTNPVNAPFYAQNNYKDGQVKGSGLNFFAQDQATAGRLVAGDRVFVTKTEVKESSVVVSLLSVDTIHGLRAKASVAFQFPKGYLANAAFPQIAPVIDELLVSEGPRPGPAPQNASPPTQPVSINLGDSVDQVMAAMGQPILIADLDRKLVFLYPEVKVTFLEGRVADVK
jgi:uncharacterized protein YaiE (UPF0345 family)